MRILERKEKEIRRKNFPAISLTRSLRFPSRELSPQKGRLFLLSSQEYILNYRHFILVVLHLSFSRKSYSTFFASVTHINQNIYTRGLLMLSYEVYLGAIKAQPKLNLQAVTSLS